MKKVLLIALAVLGLNLATVVPTLAQDNQSDASTSDTVNVIEIVEIAPELTIAEKIDAFIASQEEVNKNLEVKINNANRRLQDIQNNSSWRWFMRDMMPVFVLAVIGVFLVAIVYVFSIMRYRVNQVKYDTILKCTEKTGNVPDFFNKVERRRAAAIPVGGRVHLIISIISGTISLIFMLCAINMYGFIRMGMCLGLAAIFAAAAAKLFMQFNSISENSRKEE